MESICPICKKPYDGVVCTQCTVTDLDVSGLMASEGLHVETVEKPDDGATAFLVDLVSNRKIPITTPRCKVGRDDLNDIVISGDQSISRFHFVITKENNQYLVQDGKSRHGTFLNGNQIITPEPIHDGDVLKVGVSLFWFVIENVVLGAESDKTSPVDMEADEAELEFGAPEPSAGHLVSGGKAAAAPSRGSTASLTETGAFPALDMSTPEVEAFTARVKESSLNQSLIASLTQNSLKEPAADSANTMQNLIDKAQEEFASAGDGKKQSKERSNPESDADHSYRTPHDPSETVKTMSDSQDYGNLSFSEPLAEVVNDIGSHSLTAQDSSSPAGSTEDPAQPQENSASSVGSQFGAANESRSDKEESSSEHSDTKVLKGTLGASTLEHAVNSEEPMHNNFGVLFESDSLTGTVPSSSWLENSLDFGAEDGHDSASQGEQSLELAHDQFIDPVSESSYGQSEGTSADQPADQPADQVSELSTVTADSEDSSQSPAEVSSASTLEKLAEAVEEAGSLNSPIPKEDSILVQLINEAYANQTPAVSVSHENGGREGNGLSSEKPTSNGAKSLMSTTKESLNATVPEWCNRYFAGELTRLSKELTDLNEQVRYANQKIKEVEGRVSLAKGLRNTLLTSTGEELVEGCGRVLSLLGWKVKISDDDKSELRIETDEKHICIARIVYTEGQADRTHLGQLSISQTRHWCEQGVEPKGILIVSRSGENGPQSLTANDMNSELADYASKKNVCLMTTLQLLAIFRDIALHDGSMETARATIMASNGWLPGFNLEPGDEKEETSTNKLSSLLSA
jgi:pSer/pThr/pTyr-binding forkhead associated (FHA) protein/DNA replication initiation complex subunit (GINS family)